MIILKFIRAAGLLSFLLFFNTNYSFSADLTDSYINEKPGGKTLDKKYWERIKSDYRYKSPKVDSTTNKRQENKVAPSVSAVGGLFTILAYVAIIVLFVLIIYLIIRFGFAGNKKFQNNSPGFDIHPEPEDINDIVIDPLLAEALRKGDYRLAVRLRFLALLQILNNKNLIRWKRDRTNMNYIHQLSKNKIQLVFRQLCLTYETVWYGDYPMEKEGYQRINKKFEQAFLLTGSKEYA